MIIFYRPRFHFWVIMMSPCFVGCHNAVKKFLTFIFIARQQLLANSISWNFLLCCQHARNLSCTNLPKLKNINNMTHTFLRNAKLDSSFPLSDLLTVLNQVDLYQHFSLWNSLVVITVAHFIHDHINQLFFIQHFYIFGPVIHNTHINSDYHKHPAFGSEFQLERLLKQSKIKWGEG